MCQRLIEEENQLSCEELIEGCWQSFEKIQQELEAKMNRKSSLRNKTDTESMRADEVSTEVVPLSVSSDAAPTSRNKTAIKLDTFQQALIQNDRRHCNPYLTIVQ